MDPITHLASGVVAGGALRGRLDTRLAWPLAMVSATVPDVDVFLPGDPEFFLRVHRGITHSLVGGAALALLTALAFRLFSRKLPLRATLPAALGIVGMHLFLDVMTTYGTQLLAPFSDLRVGLPGLYIVDPLFLVTLAGLIALVLRLCGATRAGTDARTAARRRVWGRRAAWAGVVWIFFYPLTCLNMGNGVRTAVAYRLVAGQEAGPGVTDVRVIPDALAPIYWKIVATRGDTVLMGSARLGASAAPLNLTAYRRADENLLRELGERDSLFATYAWFADYPVMVRRALPGGGRAVEFRDLRFTTAVNFLKPLLNGADRPWPFSLTARFAPDGTYAGLVFERHGRAFIRPALE
jgi:inner membrane protein